MARFIKCIEFHAPDCTVRFAPVTNVPGFSHRVLLLDAHRQLVAQDWLAAGTRISEKVADYYCNKHDARRAC